MEAIIVNSKISLKNYIRFNLRLIYKIPAMLYLLLIKLIPLAILLPLTLVSPERNFTVLLSLLLFIFVFALVIHLFFIVGAIIGYKLQKPLHEEVTYEFNNYCLIIKGESFSTRAIWDENHTIRYFKEWILINKGPKIYQIAYLIPRDNFSSDQLADLMLLSAEI